MEVKAPNDSLDLVEADIIKASVRGALQVLDLPVWDEKLFLPAHKNFVSLLKVFVDIILIHRFVSNTTPRGELAPVVHVDLIRSRPLSPAGIERVLGANHLALKVRCQHGVVLCQALDAQIAAQERLGHINILELNVDLVGRAARLLSANKARSRAQK